MTKQTVFQLKFLQACCFWPTKPPPQISLPMQLSVNPTNRHRKSATTFKSMTFWKQAHKKLCTLHFVMMQLLTVEMQRQIINTTWWLFTLPKWGWKYSKVILHDLVRVVSIRDLTTTQCYTSKPIHNGSAGLKQLHKSKWHYHLRHENGNTDQANDTMWDACLWSLQLNQSRMTASTWANCFCAWMNVYLEHHLSPHNSVCVCVRACVRVHVWIHACSECYTCLQVYVCGRSQGGQEGERMWEWDICISFTFHFIVILNVPSWVLSPCVKGNFLIFMPCILMTNKDLID